MKVSYDFHIHTAASPCGDELMSPNNIVGMARILEKQIIAITDHNSCANCEAVIKCGKKEGLIVIPGMEIECMEEFHAVALFPSLEIAKDIEKEVQSHMPFIKNKTEIFGKQIILNEEDEEVGEIERLLLTATQISIYDLYKMVEGVGGIIYPAHIDRNSYSILSNLGMLPEDLPFVNLEVSHNAQIEEYEKRYQGYRLLRGSDAHYLEQLCEKEQFIELENLSKSNMLEILRKS